MEYIVWIYRTLLICLLVDGHLHCFYLLTMAKIFVHCLVDSHKDPVKIATMGKQYGSPSKIQK